MVAAETTYGATVPGAGAGGCGGLGGGLGGGGGGEGGVGDGGGGEGGVGGGEGGLGGDGHCSKHSNPAPANEVLPAGHGVHMASPLTEKVPAGHGTHDVAPWRGCAVPGSHMKHHSTPSALLLYLPGAHS